MNITPEPKDNETDSQPSPEVHAEGHPKGKTASSAVAMEISDATRDRIAENARLREELHELMSTELKLPCTVIAPSSWYTYMTRFPTVLPPKFYALLDLEESEGARYMYCYENNGRVNLGLYPIVNGQENILYSFNIEGGITS